VFLFIFPALIDTLASALKVFLLLSQIFGDGVPSLLVELLFLLGKLLHQFYSSLFTLFNFVDQPFSQYNCRRLRMLTSVSCRRYFLLPRNNVLVQIVSLILTVTYVSNIPVFTVHQFTLQLF